MDFRFKVNDWVVCTREKYGLSPGPRAKNISPSPHGDLYAYEVDKYWIVREVLPESIVLETRTGKKHEMQKCDRRLRPPTWWERFFYSDRFPRKSPRDTPPTTIDSTKASAANLASPSQPTPDRNAIERIA